MQEVNLHSRRKLPARQVSPCYFPHLPDSHTAGTMQLPCGQIQFGNVGLSVWTLSNVTNRHLAAGLLRAFKQKEWCSAGHSQPSYSPASVSLWLSWLSSSRQSVSPLHSMIHSGASPKLTQKEMEWIWSPAATAGSPQAAVSSRA